MSDDLRACPKCNERDAFQRREDGSWYCLYVTQCGYTEDAMDETEQPMATEEGRRLSESVDRLDRTMNDVLYLKDMRIELLERELGADVRAGTSGDAKRVTRRGKNKLLGRLIGKAGLWRWLWK